MKIPAGDLSPFQNPHEKRLTTSDKKNFRLSVNSVKDAPEFKFNDKKSPSIMSLNDLASTYKVLQEQLLGKEMVQAMVGSPDVP